MTPEQEILFERLTAESDRIANVVFPSIQKQVDESRDTGDVESLKDAIRKQKNYNIRMRDIVQMLEKITE